MAEEKRKVHETLKKFFGEEWINLEMSRAKTSGYDNMNPMNLAQLDSHPLIKAMIDTQIKMAVLEGRGSDSFPVGKSETIQDLLHKNLTTLEDKLDFNDIQRRLRNKEEFSKVEYEIAISAGYRRMEYDINFIPRQANSRTGEFVVTNKNGSEVLVECKKKNMTTPAQQKINAWWEEFQHLTMTSLKNNKKCYGVVVFIPPNSDRKDIPKLREEIVKITSSDLEGEFSLLDDKYRIVLKRFCNIGESIPSKLFEEFTRSYDHDHGVQSVKHEKSAWPLGRFRAENYFDPFCVFGKDPSEFINERITGVISTLGDAYGQLSEDKANLVYVDINIASSTPETRHSVLVRLIPAIQEKLTRDYSKISAVVITNIKILGHSEIFGFRTDEYVIFNPKAKNKIPNDFKIYGDLLSGRSILEDLKAILL